MPKNAATYQQAGAAGYKLLCCMRGGLREPIQRIYTTLGWLQREMDTVARPDNCLAGKEHIDRYGAVVV
jgi:hypothetical protein